MCLLAFGYRIRPDFPLVLIANRDEFHDRPTAPAALWEDAPGLLAGRDLEGGGTWLGITTTGRLAALTNYRDPSARSLGAPSRGRLVADYLRGTASPSEYLEGVAGEAGRYNPFNLVVGDRSGLHSFGSRGGPRGPLEPGVYGLSNRLLDTPWPKVIRSKESLRAALAAGEEPGVESLFALLADRSPAEDDLLPDTGVGPEWERRLSSAFIVSPTYGTRSSTVLLAREDGDASFTERTFDPDGRPVTTLAFTLHERA